MDEELTLRYEEIRDIQGEIEEREAWEEITEDIVTLRVALYYWSTGERYPGEH